MAQQKRRCHPHEATGPSPTDLQAWLCNRRPIVCPLSHGWQRVMSMSIRLRTNVQPKRVAVVVPRYGLIGGGEKLVYELTERIAEDQRWEVHVFANRWKTGSDAIHFHHVPIIAFPRFFTPLSFALFARQRINRLGVDIIHTHERILEANVYSVHGIPHAVWVRQVRQKKFLSLFDHTLANIEKRLIHHPDCKRLLAVSSITAEKLNLAFSGIADRISVVSPGIDMDPFLHWDRQDCRMALRRQVGWGAEDIVLLFVGMNFEIKGLDRILEALSRVNRCNMTATIRLLVVGKGSIQKHRQLANSLGIRDQVVFTGPVESDIERIYLGSDMFILLSQFDTFGLVVLEAMAAGLPVVISRNVGARDVVKNGWNGFVVDAEALDSVVDKINCIASPDTRHQMGINAFKTAQTHSWDEMANKVIAVYDEMTS